MPAIVNGTDGITFPSWTTPTRPAVPVAGQAGFNTTIGAMETYTGSAWSTSDLPATGASGNFLQSTGTSWTSASTLAVSNGGTGQTTLTTAYGVLAAGTTATGALQNIGTGTSTQVLTSNGPGVLPSFQAAAAGGFSNMTVFTSPGTFTTPSSTTRIKVTVVGGGGGGGNASGPVSGGGGGGGGAAIYVGPVSASTPYAVTVGAGGGGGAYTVPGSPGGTSSFASLASATGGTGGSTSSGPINTGGSGTAGTLQFTGSDGAPLGARNVQSFNSSGGGSFFAGYNQCNPTVSNPGKNYGGGGKGGCTGNLAPVTAGGGGVVVVEF
jgi:hypothetical protein